MSTVIQNLGRLLVVVVVIGVVFIEVQRVRPSTAGETPPADSASPVPSVDGPLPQASDCITSESVVDGAPPTIGLMAKTSDVAMIATVTDVGEAMWTTADGSPPPRREEYDRK